MKEIYLKAAERIATGKDDFSCLAIDHVLGCSYGDARCLYTKIMKPDDCDEFDWADRISNGDQDATNLRIMLLCMMAAVVDDL